MRRAFTRIAAGAAVAALAVTTGPAASADPAPGFDFDPAKLDARMDDCMAYAVDEQFLLMGWINVSTGETRQWRCSSLRHMLLDPRPSGPHDPNVHVNDFMRCADRVVSYGFPRPGDPGNTRYILQYRGTERRGNVVVNDANSDIATIYTEPNNDWTECAYWQPAVTDRVDQRSPWRLTYAGTHATTGSSAADQATP
ncbi:hypothetical protein [Actinokineospora iranica]|uniref:Secreted protein n=1 Tax=Actinokineospora iranica TaxID=1271860 RepID=A0A1G6QYP5_9PSEU|nr:hypothetical protein [Actinokineospora iranica]SDC97391.1 hypothetical protein SAMN05216174_10640 [Actinokineospora iranica]